MGYPVTPLCWGTARRCGLEGAQRGGCLCHHWRVHMIEQPDTDPTDVGRLTEREVIVGRLIRPGNPPNFHLDVGREGGQIQTRKK